MGTANREGVPEFSVRVILGRTNLRRGDALIQFYAGARSDSRLPGRDQDGRTRALTKVYRHRDAEIVKNDKQSVFMQQAGDAVRRDCTELRG